VIRAAPAAPWVPEAVRLALPVATLRRSITHELVVHDPESAFSAEVLRDAQGIQAVLEAVLVDGTDLRLDAATNSHGELA